MHLKSATICIVLTYINLFASEPETFAAYRPSDETITELVLPTQVTRIDHRFFERLKNLKMLVIPNGVLGIHSGIHEFFNIPNGITIYTNNKHIKHFISSNGQKTTIKSVEDAPERIFTGSKPNYIKENNAIKPAISASSICVPLIGCVDISSFAGRPIVAEGGFTGQNSLTSVILPKETELICSAAFMHCEGLLSINIPQTVKSIEDHAFAYCRSLSNITMVFGLQKIGRYAFSECQRLHSLNIPDSVESIEQCAFFRAGLKNIKLSESLTHITSGCFSNCYNLESINIPKNIFSIDGHAFNKCRSLKNISIEGSLKYIGEYAFYGCKELKTINIPNSVISIGEKAFHGCDKCVFIVHNQRTKNLLLNCSSNIKKSMIILKDS